MMIENIKQFVRKEHVLIIIIVSILAIYFLYCWLYRGSGIKENKVKGGSAFTWFPVKARNENDFLVLNITNSYLTMKDFQDFLVGVEIKEYKRKLADFQVKPELPEDFKIGCWDLEFYYGYYEYDERTHEGFPWIKIGVASRDVIFDIGEEAKTHRDLLVMGGVKWFRVLMLRLFYLMMNSLLNYLTMISF